MADVLPPNASRVQSCSHCCQFRGQALLKDVYETSNPSFSLSHLFGLLVKDRWHGEDGGALIKCSSKTFPVLIQLTWDLFYLCGGVVTGLRQAARYWHDSVDIYIGILGRKKKNINKTLLVTNWLILLVLLSSLQLNLIIVNIFHKILSSHSNLYK